MKRILILICTMAGILLCSMAICISVSAATFGVYTYTVSGGEAKITDCNTAVVGNLVIPEIINGCPVTSIGDSAFSQCTGITSVTIHSGIETIETDAFLNCYNLSTLFISDIEKWCSIKFGSPASNPLYYEGGYICLNGSIIFDVVLPDVVNAYAFYGCSSLESVTVPSTISRIGVNAFGKCPNIENVKVADVDSWSRANITGSPFPSSWKMYVGDKLVEKVEIPEGITEIKRNFSYCSSLKEIVLPESVVSVGVYAFYDCENLLKIEIKGKVASFGMYSFSGCNSIKEVHLSDVASWCGASFEKEANPFMKSASLYMNGKLINKLNIPKGVTCVKSNAFQNAGSIKEVVFPASITAIESRAFSGCPDLESIKIYSEHLEKIGSYAFDNCDKLESVYVFSDIIGEIEGYAFSNCDSLWDVVVDDMMVWYGISFENEWANPLSNGAYISEGEELITSLVVPSSVAEIKPYAFYGCESIMDLDIEAGVGKIGEYAFSKCELMMYADIAAAEIAENAFFKNSLYSLNIKEGTKTIGERAFASGESLTNINFEKGITSIASNCFEGCTSIIDVTTASSLPEEIFADHTSLIDVTILDGAESIGKGAFSGCTGLSHIYANSKTLKSIGSIAFYDCENIAAVYIDDLKVWCSVQFENGSANPLSYATRLVVDGETLSVLDISSDITSISGYAFYGFGAITEVNIPSEVLTIGTEAFYDCDKIKSVNVSAKEIGECAFYDCDGIESVVVGDGTEEIGEEAFCGCVSLKEVELGKGITYISSDAFSSCDILEKVTFSAESTGKAFSKIPIKTAILKNGVKYISNNAFYGCDELETVVIPGSVVSIGRQAFFSCDSLAEIELPDSVDYIYYGAFGYCENLKSIVMPKSIITIEESTFYNCYALEEIVLPYGLKIIPTNAFYECTSLCKITIPRTVKEIKSNAFRYCSNIDEVIFTGSKTEWNNIESGSNNGWLINCFYKTFLDLPRVSVSFELGGGSGEFGTVSVDGGTTFSIPQNIPQKDNFKFMGWSTVSGSSEAEYSPGAQITVEEGNTVLYAVWKRMVSLSVQSINGIIMVTPTNAQAGDKLIVAYYSGGKMAGHSIYNYNGEAAIPFMTTCNYDNVKIMIWDGSVDTIYPLGESKSI